MKNDRHYLGIHNTVGHINRCPRTEQCEKGLVGFGKTTAVTDLSPYIMHDAPIPSQDMCHNGHTSRACLYSNMKQK